MRWAVIAALIAFVILAALGGAALIIVAAHVPIAANRPSAYNDALARKILSCRNVLFVGAHPDDIEFYCSGLIVSLKRRGSQVTFAVGTRGGKGRQGKAKQRLENLRSHHQLDAARVLGGVDVVLFDYPDKDLSSRVEEFAAKLRQLIAQRKPDMIVAWDPHHIYNPHPDHIAAARAAEMAVNVVSCAICYYGTTQPNLWLGFEDDVFRVKLKAIRAHRTEVPWFLYPFAKRFLTKKDKTEGAKIGAAYAETYRCPNSE